MKIYAISLRRHRLDGSVCTRIVTRVEANDERQALCRYLMDHPEIEDAILGRPNGKWKLCFLSNAYSEYYVADETQPDYEVTEEMKEEIFSRTT